MADRLSVGEAYGTGPAAVSFSMYRVSLQNIGTCGRKHSTPVSHLPKITVVVIEGWCNCTPGGILFPCATEMEFY